MPKYSITALLWLFALFAAGMATFGPGLGIAAGVAVLLGWQITGWQGKTGCLLIAVIGPVLVAILWSQVGSAREAALRSWCMSNVKQLGLAMYNYHDVNGAFPPAVVTDDEGRPMHSWRVLLLPYLGEQDLYDQYDFDEPWDGPNNRKLADQMPEVFRCPGCEDCRRVRGLRWSIPGPNVSSYHVAAAPEAAIHETTGSTFAEFTDGSQNTLLLIEGHDRDKNWLEPDAYTLDEAVALLTSQDALRHPSRQDTFLTTGVYGSRGHLGWADGHTAYLDVLTPEAAIASLTAHGGEPTPDEFLRIKLARQGDVSYSIRWDRMFALAAFVALALAPKWRRSAAASENEAGENHEGTKTPSED